MFNKEKLSGLAGALETKKEKCFKREVRKIPLSCPIAVREIKINMTFQRLPQNIR